MCVSFLRMRDDNAWREKAGMLGRYHLYHGRLVLLHVRRCAIERDDSGRGILLCRLVVVSFRCMSDFVACRETNLRRVRPRAFASGSLAFFAAAQAIGDGDGLAGVVVFDPAGRVAKAFVR